MSIPEFIIEKVDIEVPNLVWVSVRISHTGYFLHMYLDRDSRDLSLSSRSMIFYYNTEGMWDVVHDGINEKIILKGLAVHQSAEDGEAFRNIAIADRMQYRIALEQIAFLKGWVFGLTTPIMPLNRETTECEFTEEIR